MPLMRIRSVEIVFEDEMSTCTDTGLLDRSIELVASDSDDSTKCVDDLEHLQVERDDNDDSVTLNADVDLSDDVSVSITKGNVLVDEPPEIETPQLSFQDDTSHAQSESVTSVNEDATLSLNASDVVDSGRYTEDACSSHFESVPILAYEDALLSHSFDVIDQTTANSYEISEVCSMVESKARLYEYIDSNSDSSDNTAVCEELAPIQHLPVFHNAIALSVTDTSGSDANDLQYDSFIDMGKF